MPHLGSIASRVRRHPLASAAVAFGMLTLGVGAAVHAHDAHAPVGRVVRLGPPAAAEPAPSPLPPPATTHRPVAPVPGGSRPPARGVWQIVTTDTARTVRGQMALVQDLEAAIRAQIERLLVPPVRP
jgi:hypothetical protein